MSIRSLSSMRTRVMRIAGLSANDGELSGAVDDFINRSYVDICRRFNWSWLELESGFTTVAPHSTGTIDTTAGATSITANAVTSFTSSQVGYFIQIDSLGQEFHKITAFSSSGSLTVDTAISGDTTASTYMIFKTDYELDTKVDPSSIQFMVETETSTRLQYVDPQSLEMSLPNMGALNQTNPPRYWSLIGMGTTGNSVIRLYPVPSNAIYIRYRAVAALTPMSTGNDVPLLPDRFQDVVENGALTLVYNWQGRDSLAKTYGQLFEANLKTMLVAENKREIWATPRAENDLPKYKSGPSIKYPAAFGGEKV